MIDPYKMITVNIALLVILGITIGIYRYIFRKKINFLFLLLLITAITSLSIFRVGSYESGDFNIHVIRSMEFYKSLMEGNIAPSWAPDLNATYGYPLFIFNYSLPYYLVSFIHILGFTFINSLKIYIALNMLASALFMYMLIKHKFKNELTAFGAAIFYVFFPYHLVSVHFKITIGEILAYTLLPLLFLFIEKCCTLWKKKYIIAAALTLGLIGLSHLFIGIFAVPLIAIYSYLYIKNLQKTVLISISITIIATLICAYQWLPPIIFNNHLFTSINPIDISTIYFPTLNDLLFSPWRFGFLFQGPKGEISNLIGYAQIAILFLLSFYLLKNKFNKLQKLEVGGLILATTISLFFITEHSRFLWKNIPFLYTAGPHRLLIIVGFLIAILSTYLFITIKYKPVIYILIFIALLSTMLNWGQRKVVSDITDEVLATSIPQSTYLGEAHFYANTKYVDKTKPWFSQLPSNKIDLPKENGNIMSGPRSSTKHVYKASITKKSLVTENTLYFPGWRAFANRSELPTFPSKNGLINFNAPKGKYNLEVIYEDVYSLKIAKALSMFTLSACLLYLFLEFKLHRFR